MSDYCIDLNDLDIGFKHPLVNILWTLFRRFNIKIKSTGGFVDETTGNQIRNNHLRCMLRKECMNMNVSMRGKALEKFIDVFLVAIVRAAQETVKTHPESFATQGHVQITGEFL